MTIRLLAAWNGYPANAIISIDAGTETGLIADKMASSNLTGGVVYTSPIIPPQLKESRSVVDPVSGLSMGVGHGTVVSGVAFGPPTTIFRLRMRCSGGAATVTVVATKRSGGSDTYTFSLASGGDVSEPMYADDYSSLVWTKTGAGSVTVEVI